MFYTLDQNNSGGYFEENKGEGICEYVIIEADNLEGFRHKANTLLEGYRNYCPCCGERWSEDFIDEEDGDSVPAIYGQPLDEHERGPFRQRAYIHYLDGTIKEHVFKEKYGVTV